MTEPYVGDLDDPRNIDRCGYSDAPGEPRCPGEARWHGITADWKGIHACIAHRPFLDHLCRWVHEEESACGLPDAEFFEDTNRCGLPWPGVELAFAIEAREARL